MLRLLGSILIEQNDEWVVSRNPISKESLKKALALRAREQTRGGANRAREGRLNIEQSQSNQWQFTSLVGT